MQGNILASFRLTISGKSMLLGVMMEQVIATLKMDSSEAIVPVKGRNLWIHTLCWSLSPNSQSPKVEVESRCFCRLRQGPHLLLWVFTQAPCVFQWQLGLDKVLVCNNQFSVYKVTRSTKVLSIVVSVVLLHGWRMGAASTRSSYQL